MINSAAKAITISVLVTSVMAMIVTSMARADDLQINRDITIKDTAGVKTDEVCLQDLVVDYWVQGRCAVDKQKCCKWNLNGEPKLIISKGEIEKEVSKIQFGSIKVNVQGANEIEVTKTHRTLTQAELEERIKYNLTSKMGEEKNKVSIVVEKLKTPVYIPIDRKNDWDVIFTGQSTDEFSAKIVSGMNQQDILGWVNVSVKAIEETYVAKRAIKPTEVTQVSDFELKKIEVPMAMIQSKQYFKPGEFPEGLRTKQTVAKGTPLTNSVLERVPVVKLGDSVTLILRSDTLRVSTKGVAQGTAAIGDMVTVQLNKYNRTFRGRLVESKLVEVWL